MEQLWALGLFNERPLFASASNSPSALDNVRADPVHPDMSPSCPESGLVVAVVGNLGGDWDALVHWASRRGS